MPIYVMIAAACHDPAAFPNPHRFDIDRPNVKDHLAFGFGIHTCIGNAIARHVAPMVVGKAAECIPNLCIVGDLEWNIATPRARHLEKMVLAV